MKTVLITGSNRGIGLEFVRQYAADEWRVIACARHPEQAQTLQQLALQYPQQIEVYALDVADHAHITHLAQTLSDTALDVLINNAGIYPASDSHGFGHTDYDDWAEAFRINTMAPLKMAEAFAAHIARSEQKTLVTITSKMGSVADNTSGGNYIYRSSKAAVNMVVKSLSIDLANLGITAILLHPGWVKTEMGGPNAWITTEQSVNGLRQLIKNLTRADAGKFFAYDGQELPW
ncbi:MAG: SDR family oxidoreductase [Methylophilaceae bacterium]|nr:SDR family oxidoreductase [Methylophilaceae bacterium]